MASNHTGSDSGLSQPKTPQQFKIPVKRILFGKPRDITDGSIFHRLALIPVLAWVGLGADGLSSSCYGPEEMFRTVGEHTYLGIGLALATTLTVFVISYAYSRVIEHFPHGGGGYVVTTKLLGRRFGVVSGSALLVDYVLTITVSIAAAGDALFSFMPHSWAGWKMSFEIFCIVFLIILNSRGVKESVIALAPIFFLFVLTHIVLIVGGIAVHAPELPQTLHTARQGFSTGLSTLGWGGLILIFMRAYSLGGGTFTGIEAVSNGLPILREPHEKTGKRTMLYMAASLAFTASGLVLCYLLWNVSAVPGKTMNAVLAERFVDVVPLGWIFVVLTLVSEGAILVVAAQAGFVDGPRVLANMAIDGWAPSRFAALSERLTVRNGILLMGITSLLALLYTGGDVRQIVVMYSINVFLSFSLTNLSMTRFWIRERKRRSDWRRKITIHIVGLVMCLTIFGVTVFEKFSEGGWLTLTVTSAVIALSFLIRRHYRAIWAGVSREYKRLENLPRSANETPDKLDPDKPTAVAFVASYSGLGIHTVLNIFKSFPNLYKNILFISVGVLDSGEFKGEGAVEALKERTKASLNQYVALAHELGLPADYRFAIGTDVVHESEKLCSEIVAEFPQATFFGGKLVFRRESWYQRLLHNETAFAIERRLQQKGMTMVVLPAMVT